MIHDQNLLIYLELIVFVFFSDMMMAQLMLLLVVLVLVWLLRVMVMKRAMNDLLKEIRVMLSNFHTNMMI